ncbi:Integrase-type DNA-binding superfamily protein [Perilla frutescens var. frutescens]|nr:Integrase-type DNA-binding superfamily protein [Perilla frutescens var. frutescens]
MASSMNNWLGFSLSPQELQDHPQSSVPHLGFNSDEISAAHHTISGDDSCFDLPSDSTIPSLNLPAPPFGILEAFNRNPHSQDWNINTFSCSSQSLEDQNRPKLENFLGVHHQERKSNNYHLNGSDDSIYQETEATSSHTNNGSNGSTIGLSMITNWLRNNPAPPHAAENEAAATAGSGAAQTLSLSMSTGSQSSSPLPSDTKLAAEGAIESVPRKSIDTFGQRTSIYRGVTRHRWTGRYEAHLWDNSCRREGQTRKGRQGGYDKEDKAARSYDLAALKYWGTTTTTNFPISNYEKEIEEMKHMTRQEYVASLRRKSSGFSRGASMYRGVTRHHQHGRWQARIGRVAGNKDLYLGTFSTEEEAAEAYDIAAIKFRGLNAVTNFEINRYDVKSILESSTLPIGGAAKRLKDAEKAEMALNLHRANESSLSLAQMAAYGGTNTHAPWPTIAFHQSPPLMSMYPYAHQRLWCKQEHEHGHEHDSTTGISHGSLINEINTHNFLQQPPNSLLHNIMGLDSSSMEPTYGSTAMIVQDHGHGMNVFVGSGEEGLFGSSADARNFYYQSQQSSSPSSAALGGGGGGSASSTNWIPTAVPTLSARAAHNIATTFSVWNDT